MKKHKFLITGGSGLLAVNWALLQRTIADVTLCFHKRIINLTGVKSTVCNLDSVNHISSLLKKYKPDVVIHTAGLTNVEKCQQNPELAEYVNVDIAKNVSVACSSQGCKLVHISTDHLFDGKKTLLNEEAKLNPLNVYGYTKAKAEEAVYQNNQNALIIRTNFYGWGTIYRQSFSDYIINSLRKKQNIYLFDDVIYTPIVVSQLVKSTYDLIQKGLLGVFNVVGDDCLSKYKFGIKLANKFKLDSSLIKNNQIENENDLVLRPKNMSLTNNKLSFHLGRCIGGVDKHLNLLIKQETKGIPMELLNL